MLRFRRVLIVTVAVLLVGSAASATAWYVVLPEYRPSLRPGEHYGVDVSHHQGRIDWRRVAGDDISFAYIKATEGETWVDSEFAANWQGAASVGLSRGAYHFFSLCVPGANQARHFLATVPDDPQALPPVVDLEFGTCTQRPDPATVEREVSAFVDLVERERGRPVVLYVMRDYTDRYPFLGSLERDRWERRLFRRPDGPWVMWQVSNVARVDGVPAPVDLNVSEIGRAGG